jgi:hypothetical protein
VIPYLPLRSLPVVGLASQQYTFLGFKLVAPSAGGSSVRVYEDDGVTTDYLTADAYAWTECSYTASGSTLTVQISTTGTFPQLPATRAYQLRLLNVGALASVELSGAASGAVPFARFAGVAREGRVPAASAWSWEFGTQQAGMGPVIDIVGVSTAPGAVLTVAITLAAPAVDLSAGHYGYIQRGVWGKSNLDLDRSTPASNSPGPAYLSVLASTGEALSTLAGKDPAAFAAAVGNVTSLVASAISDVQGLKSPRKNMTLALLSV